MAVAAAAGDRCGATADGRARPRLEVYDAPTPTSLARRRSRCRFRMCPRRTSTTSQYALDVNVERVEDTLTHQRLLEEAQYLQDRLALAVGVFQIAEILSKLQIKDGGQERL